MFYLRIRMALQTTDTQNLSTEKHVSPNLSKASNMYRPTATPTILYVFWDHFGVQGSHGCCGIYYQWVIN